MEVFIVSGLPKITPFQVHWIGLRDLWSCYWSSSRDASRTILSSFGLGLAKWSCLDDHCIKISFSTTLQFP